MTYGRKTMQPLEKWGGMDNIETFSLTANPTYATIQGQSCYRETRSNGLKFCYITASINITQSTGGNAIASIPDGYRPKYLNYLPTWEHGGAMYASGSGITGYLDAGLHGINICYLCE